MNMSLQLLKKPLFGSFALHTQLFLFGSVLFLPLFLEVRCYSLATPELDSHVQLIFYRDSDWYCIKVKGTLLYKGERYLMYWFTKMGWAWEEDKGLDHLFLC